MQAMEQPLQSMDPWILCAYVCACGMAWETVMWEIS